MENLERDKKVQEVLEDIMEAHVNCGGIFKKSTEIKNWTVEFLLNQLIPNDVVFDIQHKPAYTPQINENSNLRENIIDVISKLSARIEQLQRHRDEHLYDRNPEDAKICTIKSDELSMVCRNLKELVGL